MSEHKTCTRCQQALPLSLFGVGRNGKHVYIKSWCNDCTNARNRQRYAERKHGIAIPQPDEPPKPPFFQHVAPAPSWLELRAAGKPQSHAPSVGCKPTSRTFNG
jgi:hypothetical protein